MVSWGTLGSVEFLGLVVGDLEVPPDEAFDLKVKSSQNHLLCRERSSICPLNQNSLSQYALKAAPDRMETTATSWATSRATASRPGTAGKSPQFKVYCSRRRSPSRSLRCSFQVCCFGPSRPRVFYGFDWPGANEIQVKVVSEPEQIDVFLTRSCVQLTDISCGVVYEATLPSLVLFRI